jgi:hypothetical protein
MESQSTQIADAATATEEIPYSFAVSGEGKPYLFGYGVYEVGYGGRLTRIAGGTLRDPTAATGSSDGSILYIAEAGALAHNEASFCQGVVFWGVGARLIGLARSGGRVGSSVVLGPRSDLSEEPAFQDVEPVTLDEESFLIVLRTRLGQDVAERRASLMRCC